MNKLSSLQSQVKPLKLQDKSGEKTFIRIWKKFEPITKTIKDVSRDVKRTLTEGPKENNKALQSLNNILLEILIDSGLIPTYLLSLLSKINIPEHTSQFKLVNGGNSIRVNDLLLNQRMPVILFDKLSTFRDTDEKFKLEGMFSKMITDKNYKVDLAILPYKKLMFEFAKELFLMKKL